jgi:nucleoside-diphosphate-sugar epimerase
MIQNQNVIVTGAAGFVGSHLVDELLANGNRVVAFDYIPLDSAWNLQAVRTNKDLVYCQGDIRDIESLRKAFKAVPKVSQIFHLASIVGVNKYMEDPFGLIDITIGGTRNVAQLAREFGTRILYTSTSEVYGKNPKVPWSEEDDRVLGNTTIDRWSYSTSKATCEHLLLALHKQSKHPVTIVRYFNVYGPRQSPIFVVSKSVHRVLHNLAPLVYDGGAQTRCFTYVKDAVQGTLMAAESDKSIGHVFNIGNSKEISMLEAVETVIKASGKDLKWENLDTAQHYGKVYEDIPRRVPAVQKAKEILGWQVFTSHVDGITESVRWAERPENSWWLRG